MEFLQVTRKLVHCRQIPAWFDPLYGFTPRRQRAIKKIGS